MLRQIRYFQSVVRNNSFSEAAEECHISQSAISQQIQALGCFSDKSPDVSLHITYGNHEELYDLLRLGKIDIAMNDQRRAFSSEYENMTLAELPCQVEVAARNPVAQRPFITLPELGNAPCILVASKEQQDTEREYYASIIGFRGEFIFTGSMEEARAAVVTGQGVHPIEGDCAEQVHGIARVPLYRGSVPVTRTYCAFWKRDNSGYYIEEFADILKKQFME